MGLSADAYARQLQQQLPPGAAWQAERGTKLAALLLGFADELARVDDRGRVLLDERDPRTALEQLAEWERMLGLPDTCVPGEQSVAQRRAAVVARYTSLGGQTPAYFIGVALALGFTVTITEHAAHDVDDDVETPLNGDGWAHTWQANAPLNTMAEFDVESVVEDALAWWGNAALECVLTRLKPAQTHLLFVYS